MGEFLHQNKLRIIGVVMGFGCTIKAGQKDLTNGIISSYLYGLAPNNGNETDAPYRLSDLRDVVSRCEYGHKLKEAAQDAFKALQYRVKQNIESLKPCHCDTCTCTETIPNGWSKESCKAFLEIDANSITYLSGGY